jgi:hypothetical protein
MAKEEIQEFAKELFYQGKSFRKISEEIELKFKQKISHATVKTWSEKHKWKQNKDEAIVKGIIEAKEIEIDNTKTIEETLLSKIAEDSAKQYKESKSLRSLAMIGIQRVLLTESKEIYKDFDEKKLNSLSHLFKAASDDLRKIEQLIKPEDEVPSDLLPVQIVFTRLENKLKEQQDEG